MLRGSFMSACRISIIIPHFNTPDLLSRLLSSIPESSLIQIIVVDDNSTMHLKELDLLKENNTRVEFYRNETGKNSAGTCRNIGLDHAEGEWLLFADSDDFFIEGWLEKIRPYLDTDLQIVFFRPTSIELDTGCIGSRHLMYSEKVDAYLLAASHENELRLRYDFSVPWSKLIRRSFVEEHGIRFEPLRVSNDEWFSLLCGHYVQRFACSGETIYCVTTHSGSLTTLPSKTNYDIRQKVYIRKYGFLYQHLTTSELHALGLDYMPLYILYNTAIHGYGLKKVIEYRRLLREERVPLVLWENISLKQLITRAYFSLKSRLFQKEHVMNILITGAQFGNKGAQSLLFTLVNELRGRYPDATIYYLPTDHYRPGCFDSIQNYRFQFMYDDMSVYDHPGIKLAYVKRKLTVLKKKLELRVKKCNVAYLSKKLDQIDAIIDISGYCLSSKFPISNNRRYLRYLKAAISRNKPIILLPQSFGPFDYPKEYRSLLQEIKSSLPRASLIFAREEDGRRQLLNLCGNIDVRVSPDIVLQSEEIQYDRIFTRIPKVEFIKLETTGNVGIIPNIHTADYSNEEYVLKCYQEIIRHLLKLGKTVYIFRHSDDLSLCRSIYELVKSDTNCHLIEDEMDCLSYSEFVKQFDFIIASRYHSIVHAYKEGIPAVILGWAVKYQELAQITGQEKYVFDITNPEKSDIDDILAAICAMSARNAEETACILQNVQALQKSNCFDACFEVLSKTDIK